MAPEKEFFDTEFEHFETMITAYSKHADESKTVCEIDHRQASQNEFLTEATDELNKLIELFSQLKFNKRFLAQLFEPTGQG